MRVLMVYVCFAVFACVSCLYVGVTQCRWMCIVQGMTGYLQLRSRKKMAWLTAVVELRHEVMSRGCSMKEKQMYTNVQFRGTAFVNDYKHTYC